MAASIPAPGGPSVAELRQQALSDDPTVRAQTAEAIGRRMEAEFEQVFDATQEWALDADERLREVAALACQQSREVTDEVRARRLIGRLELFLGDRSPRVAEVTTQRVLPHLLGMYPSMVPPWIQRWAPNSDEAIRADLARVLSAIAGRFPTDAVEGLAELSVDPRPRVRTAVVDALEQLEARAPTMRPYLHARFSSLLGAT
jgi:hypothetical protein